MKNIKLRMNNARHKELRLEAIDAGKNFEDYLVELLGGYIPTDEEVEEDNE